MPLQLNTIEEYDFQHGFHRNYVTGKYIAIQPHDLGRPLTHAEMDYNLILNEQTQAGFRIFGSNEDLTLSDDDLGSSLVFHKISADDDDFARYQSKGYSAGQYIWILDCCAPKFNCALFVVDSITATDSGVCSFVVDSITATPEDPCISFVVDTICSFEVESIEFQNSGSDDVLPNPTPVPEPTATEVPATPTPTATSEPVVTPTPTPGPEELNNLVFATKFDLNGEWWSTDSYGPGIDQADSGQPNAEYVNMIYSDYHDNTDGSEVALTFRNEVNAIIDQSGGFDDLNWVGWSPWKFYGQGSEWYGRGNFRLEAIHNLAYTKLNYDSNISDFPLTITKQTGLAYVGEGIGQLQIGMSLYASDGSGYGNLPSSGAILVSQTEGGKYSSDPGQTYELPQGNFEDEVNNMQNNGTSLTYVIYENWIVKRIVDLQPTTSATYPRLAYYDNQDWNTLVDNWFADNPTCSNGQGSPSAITGFIRGKLQDADMWPYPGLNSISGISASHFTRHVLWKYVNEFGGTLDTTLLNEFGQAQGCITPTPTATPNQDTSNLTFDYDVPLTADGRTYELQRPSGIAYSYSEDVSWTVSNPVYWGHEIFAEAFAGYEWTSTDQLTFTVDGNEITPDGTIQNNISIVTTIESDGRLSILTKSHNINENRIHEIIITGGPTAEAVTDRYTMSVTPPTAEESSSGNQYMQFNIQAINGYNPPAGTTVGYTITGDWEFTDIQVIGTNIGDGNNVSEPFPLIESPENPYSNIFRIGEQGGTFKTAAIRVYVTNDANIEGLEQVTVTLASEDSLGNSTSSTEVSATGEIIDVTPTPTATEVPPTATPEPTATPMATPITEMSIPHKLIVATSVYNMIFEDVSAYMLVVNNDDPIWYGGPDYSQYDINSGIYTHPDAQMLGKVPVPSCVPDGDKAELLSTINITDRGYGLEYEVSNTRVYVWFKDDNGHVYGVRDGLCYPVQNQHVHMWGMNYGSLIDILNNGQTLETSYTISDSSMVS